MENKLYYRADDIAQIMDVSIASAYRIIRELNDELKRSGYLTISGRVNKAFFDLKTGCPESFLGGNHASL